MAKSASGSTHTRVHKRTCQGGSRPKTSTLNKTKKGIKKYRGQGR